MQEMPITKDLNFDNNPLENLIVLKLSRSDMVFNPKSIKNFIDLHIKVKEYFETIIRGIVSMTKDKTGFFDPETLAKLIA